MNVLTTYDLSKRYNGRLVLDRVNMHIEQGDIYGFVGENGAGKTTVIRLITGLAAPSGGSFSLYGINNRDKDIEQAKKKLGGIVESVSLNRRMTALDNLRFQRMITSSDKSDEELISLISRVGLDYNAIKDRKAGNFSLGMRQRLGIAVTMVSDPEFVILDEPMNGLDPQGFVEVRETILRLHSEGVTFLISSHILSELDKICTKIGVISRGRLLEEMSMDELRDRSRRRILIRCTDPNEHAGLICLISDKLSLREVRPEGDGIVIFDKVDVNDVITFLAEERVSIDRINVLEETVEDFYINILRKGV